MTEPDAGISVDPQIFILETIAPDRIVIINLDRRPDRWEAMNAAWHPDLAGRFVRFPATDGKSVPHDQIESYAATRNIPPERAAGELGCRDSWLRALTAFGPALYLEDDALPCAPWSFGPPPGDAEIVLLGGELWRKTTTPGWSPIETGANGTHALWIRTQRAADQLLAAWQSKRGPAGPIDLLWRSVLPRCNAVVAVPQLICQANLDTDVQHGRVFHRNEPLLTKPWCSLTSNSRTT